MKTISINTLPYSKWAVAIIALFILFTRFTNVLDKELSWDVLGYYMYLPATFIHDDPLLKDVDWLKKEITERNLASTFYMISQNKKGEPMYYYMMGMAILYLPWFLMGHMIALVSDAPLDGFSPPYVYAMISGAIFYTLLGLFFLRKILKRFFSEGLSAFVLLIIYLGTNTVHHLIAKDLETANFLFTLCAIVLWQTIRWHEDFKPTRLYLISGSIALMTIMKPSEVFVIFLPVFYGVFNLDTFKKKLQLIKIYKKHFILSILIGVIVTSPQLLYWKMTIGRFIYDSYSNVGIGIDWWSPNFMKVLFSFKKGWLVYTPVMAFALIGWYFLYRKRKDIFSGTIVYFLTSFFVICSWTQWGYASSFSCRPVVTMYPILAVTLGFLLKYLYEEKKKLFPVVSLFILSFICLNQFQWWQFKNNILHDYRMTEEYYWKTFLKTSTSDENKKLLYSRKDFKTDLASGNLEAYKGELYREMDLNHPDEWVMRENVIHDETESYYRITENDRLGLMFKDTINDFSQKGDFFVLWEIEYKYVDKVPQDKSFLVSHLERQGEVYGYAGEELVVEEIGKYYKKEFVYTPPDFIRERTDLLGFNIWNRDRIEIHVKSLKGTIWKPIRNYSYNEGFFD